MTSCTLEDHLIGINIEVVFLTFALCGWCGKRGRMGYTSARTRPDSSFPRVLTTLTTTTRRQLKEELARKWGDVIEGNRRAWETCLPFRRQPQTLLENLGRECSNAQRDMVWHFGLPMKKSIEAWSSPQRCTGPCRDHANNHASPGLSCSNFHLETNSRISACDDVLRMAARFQAHIPPCRSWLDF